MPPLPPALLELMSKVLSGEASCDDLMHQIRAASEHLSPADGISLEANENRMAAISGATVDLGREARCGFGEVIYGEGKSAELVTQIIQTQLDDGQRALVTRIDNQVAFQVRQSFANAYHHPPARTLRVSATPVARCRPLEGVSASIGPHAAVVTAGSTDAGVAEEALETLAWMGVPVQRFDDIGVAGPQRLAAAVPQLRLASAVVVIAGMEGALPAAVAGHLACPIFAVPTSVGYGANLGGLTPLMGMLSGCAANVATVNIDAGFKGGYLAGMVVRQLIDAISRREESQSSKGAPSPELSESCEVQAAGTEDPSASKTLATSGDGV